LTLHVFTGWAKNCHGFLNAVTSLNIDQFSNFFHCQENQEKFVIVLTLNIPPNLECVATLPCEMSVS